MTTSTDTPDNGDATTDNTPANKAKFGKWFGISAAYFAAALIFSLIVTEITNSGKWGFFSLSVFALGALVFWMRKGNNRLRWIFGFITFIVILLVGFYISWPYAFTLAAIAIVGSISAATLNWWQKTHDDDDDPHWTQDLPLAKAALVVTGISMILFTIGRLYYSWVGKTAFWITVGCVAIGLLLAVGVLYFHHKKQASGGSWSFWHRLKPKPLGTTKFWKHAVFGTGILVAFVVVGLVSHLVTANNNDGTTTALESKVTALENERVAAHEMAVDAFANQVVANIHAWEALQTASQKLVNVTSPTVINGDSTANPQTPPVGSAKDRQECGVFQNWQSVVDCYGGADGQWYRDGVNMMQREGYTGYNWSDIQQWAKTGVDPRAIVVFNRTQTDDQARDSVRGLIGDEAAHKLPILRDGSIVNTMGLEADTVTPFNDNSQQTRVSLMPLDYENGQWKIHLSTDKGGDFVDCYNPWGHGQPAPVVVAPVQVAQGNGTFVPVAFVKPIGPKPYVPATGNGCVKDCKPVEECEDNPNTPKDDCNPPTECEDNPSTPVDECNPPEECEDNPNTPKDDCNPNPPKDCSNPGADGICGTQDDGGDQSPIDDNDPGHVQPTPGHDPGNVEGNDQEHCTGSDCGVDTNENGTVVGGSEGGGGMPGGNTGTDGNTGANGDGSDHSTNPDEGTADGEDVTSGGENVDAGATDPFGGISLENADTGAPADSFVAPAANMTSDTGTTGYVEAPATSYSEPAVADTTPVVTDSAPATSDVAPVTSSSVTTDTVDDAPSITDILVEVG